MFEHFIRAVVEDGRCVVALEGVENLLVVGVASHLIDNIVKVEGLFSVGELLLEELAERLLDNGVDGIDVHCLFVSLFY